MEKRSNIEIVFMVDYGLSEMSFSCDDDSHFEAVFVSKVDGETFTYVMSRQKVMEHIERVSKYPERYVTDKKLVAAHFHVMAMAWYRATHFPVKWLEEIGVKS